jgi:hypothetical protein
MEKYSYAFNRCLTFENVSDDAYNDLNGFISIIESQIDVASKQTHYHKLNDWCDTIYGFVHAMLKKHKFVNGGKNQNPDARFWWGIYGVVSSIHLSPHLKTQVALHHSSAWERNEALRIEIGGLIKILCK